MEQLMQLSVYLQRPFRQQLEEFNTCRKQKSCCLCASRQVHLSMDKSSGGAAFGSKMRYNFGFFEMMVILCNKDIAGVVTAFYLTSHRNHHDVLGFEFLGDVRGKPITLQTNIIFTNGNGNREQKIYLSFDPTADFHSYKILWNPYQVV
ncbi:unnamed protein product [Musa banksii]